ncbi:MAG: Nif3-like dinuclear metal center hexameric protein [Candidatus Kerfeldbacteria bacterium]|nr:Nif3-like dinuclear metal center hexameric protein [Candidatus Kerfeldbacteria bacterium]
MPKAVTLREFDECIATVLRTPELERFVNQDSLYNGLQTRGLGEVTHVGFGVSASMELFRLAHESGCDALVVHHGLFIPPRNLDRLTYNRLAYLIQNNIALWSAHYLLDAHPEIGNNAQIIAAVGGKIVEPYIAGSRAPWGYIAELPQPQSLAALVDRLAPRFSPDKIIYDFADKPIERFVCVSGKGGPSAEDMEQLAKNGVQLYITGEIHEWHREQFREFGISCIAGGHYHTETFGLQALQPIVEKKLDVKTTWLDLVNNV